MSRRTLLVLTVALLVVAGLVFRSADTWVAPGHMSSGHEDLAQDCFACHQALRGTPAERCIVCHEFDQGIPSLANGKLQPGSALLRIHQDFAEQTCVNCHTGHLTEFIQSATPRFDHQILSLASQSICADCHQPPRDLLHPSVGSQCEDCHQSSAWKPTTFEHRLLFPLEGPHKASCSTCHEANNFKQYTCTNCHEHSPARLQREHAEEGVRFSNDCVRCHRSGREHGGHRESHEHDD